MRRFHCLLIFALISALLMPSRSNHAQGGTGTYDSRLLGITFQYPTDWAIEEQLKTQTILAASKADFAAIAQGGKPEGLIFSLTLTSMRQVQANTPDDFPAVLARVSGGAGGVILKTQVEQAVGQEVELVDSAQDVASRTLVLSVGKRRVAIVRGVTTATAWLTGAKDTMAAIVQSLRFSEPESSTDIDQVGIPLWQISAAQMPNLTDLSLSADGSTLFATEQTNGLWKLTANGIDQGVVKPSEIASFGGVVVLQDGSQYIADPSVNTLWLLLNGQIQKVFGGQRGTGRGAFGPNSPRYFGFTSEYIYALDENESGLRIQLFGRSGNPVTFWDIPMAIENPIMALGNQGRAYIVGRNSNGIIRINAAGTLEESGIGAAALQGSTPTALLVDRFGTFYVATADQGILHLDENGGLIGIIGQPYDGGAPPKPGQLTQPVALALGGVGRGPLYVADVGKYPQIVAFALDGDIAVDLAAGTKEAGDITYGEQIKGTIDAEKFLHIYTFEGRRGDVVTIRMKGSQGLDTFLKLFRPDGKQIASADDAVNGQTDAELIEIQLPQNGTYTIHATRFGRETSRQTGDFTINLEKKQ
jgi:Bacterial pre-peptidase C-terminal domain